MMRHRSCLAVSLLIAVLLATAPAALAGIIRADRDDQLYLDLGADPLYEAVGQFSWSDTQYDYFASGTLIDSPGNLWVLTAAHVLDSSSIGERTFTLGSNSYSVVESDVYPKWNGDLSRGYDIALAKLSDAPVGVTPATLYTGSSEAGLIGTFVGYGMTGTGLTGATTFDSVKRAGQNAIDAFYRTGRTSRMFGVDFDDPNGSTQVYGDSAALELEYLTSFGDSGGGVYIDLDGSSYLAGVTSWGADYNGNGLDDDYGDVGGYIRVSAFTSWIDSVIDTSGGGGGNGHGKGGGNGNGHPKKPHDLAGLSTVVPEPATLSMLLLGGFAVLRRRRTT